MVYSFEATTKDPTVKILKDGAPFPYQVFEVRVHNDGVNITHTDFEELFPSTTYKNFEPVEVSMVIDPDKATQTRHRNLPFGSVTGRLETNDYTVDFDTRRVFQKQWGTDSEGNKILTEFPMKGAKEFAFTHVKGDNPDFKCGYLEIIFDFLGTYPGRVEVTPEDISNFKNG